MFTAELDFAFPSQCVLPSGRHVPPWPNAAADPLVERVRREIRTAGPGHRACLLVDLDLREALRCASVLEDRSPHPVEHGDRAGQAVGELKAKDAVADDSGFGIRASSRSSRVFDRLKCLTGAGTVPVLPQLGLVPTLPTR